MIQDEALNLDITQSSLISLTSLPSTEPWLIYALGGGWGHLVRALSLGRIAAIHRPVMILCNSPYTADLLQYEASDDWLCTERLLGKETLKMQKEKEEEDFSVLHSSLSLLHLADSSAFTLQTSKEFGMSDQLPIVDGCYLHVISPTSSSSATKNQVYQLMAEEHYECVIVDTFPRGLGGELTDILPQLTAPRILIHRDINSDYVRAKDLPRFVADNFDLVIVPGEKGEMPLGHLPQVRYTKPWLIRSAGELPDIERARTLVRLNPTDTGLLVLVFAAGRAEELSLYGNLTRVLSESLPGVRVRCLAAECPENCPAELWVFHWPGIECLPAADVVVGGAGYNTFYECFAVGVPLVAFAFKRLYDRQKMRVLRWTESQAPVSVTLVESVGDALCAVRDLLNLATRSPQEKLTPSTAPKPYINGVHDAVNLIEQIVSEA